MGAKFNKIIGFFKSLLDTENEQTPVARQGRNLVSMMNDQDYEETLRMIRNESYEDVGGADLSAIFLPFKSPGGVSGMPQLPDKTGVDGVSANKLYPFFWNANSSPAELINDNSLMDANKGLVSSDTYIGHTAKQRDASNVRSIGFRLPMIGVGWGYTTDGDPWPSGGTGLFAGGVISGQMVDPAHYQAAPIDLRYDKSRGVWVGGSVSGTAGGGDELTFAKLTYYNSSEQSYSGIIQEAISGVWQNTSGTAYPIKEQNGFIGIELGSIVQIYEAGDLGSGSAWSFNFVNPREIFQVSLSQTGGNDGDNNSSPTWTYQVSSPGADGSVLGNGFTPTHRTIKFLNGRTTSASQGSAFYDDEGNLVLWEAPETSSFGVIDENIWVKLTNYNTAFGWYSGIVQNENGTGGFVDTADTLAPIYEKQGLKGVDLNAIVRVFPFDERANPYSGGGTLQAYVFDFVKPNELFQVHLTAASGSDGNDTTKASYYYHALDGFGNTLAAFKSPEDQGPRMTNGSVASGNLGLGYYDHLSAFHLYAANEVHVTPSGGGSFTPLMVRLNQYNDTTKQYAGLRQKIGNGNWIDEVPPFVVSGIREQNDFIGIPSGTVVEVTSISGAKTFHFVDRGELFDVVVTKVAGNDGTHDAAATWVYDVKVNHFGQSITIDTSVSPINKPARGTNGSVIPGTRGTAFYEEDDDVKLWEVNEVPEFISDKNIWVKLTDYISSQGYYSGIIQNENGTGAFVDTANHLSFIYEKQGFLGVDDNAIVRVYPFSEIGGNLAYAFDFVSPNELFQVHLAQDGGSDGTASTTASYTYTATDGFSNVLDTGLTPQDVGPRMTNGSVATGTLGLGYYDEVSNFNLYSANEVHVTPSVSGTTGGGGETFVPLMVRLSAYNAGTMNYSGARQVVNGTGGWQDAAPEVNITGIKEQNNFIGIELGSIVEVTASGSTRTFNFVNPRELFQVGLTQISGSDGHHSAAATWRYNVYAPGAGGAQIGSDLNPTNKPYRLNNGTVVPGTQGTAFYDDEKTLVLWEADERPEDIQDKNLWVKIQGYVTAFSGVDSLYPGFDGYAAYSGLLQQPNGQGRFTDTSTTLFPIFESNNYLGVGGNIVRVYPFSRVDSIYTSGSLNADAYVFNFVDQNELFRVLLSKDGGVSGTYSDPATYTYTATGPFSQPLGTGLVPQDQTIRLYNYGRMLPALMGRGYYDHNNRFVLYDTDEEMAHKPNPFFARIDASTPLASGSSNVGGGSAVTVVYRWKYAWTEVVPTGAANAFAVPTGARSGSLSSNAALNITESAHTTTIVWGVAITGTSYPVNMRPKPVGGAGSTISHQQNRIVTMRVVQNTDGNNIYMFDAAGSHDGSC